ncbi:MAG: hypothetical protein WAT81_04535 [Candidatus Moraniibacteriota bacterium]
MEQPPVPSRQPQRPEQREVRHGSIEYYKAKNNSIDRHLDHALKIVLTRLANMDQEKYKRESDPRWANSHDVLDLKTYMVKFELPSIDQHETFEGFQEAAPDANDPDKQYDDYLLQLSEREGQAAVDYFLSEQERLYDEVAAYFSDIEAGKIQGLRVTNPSPIGGILSSTNFKEGGRVYRINIKAIPADHPVSLVKQLADKFSENRPSVPAGFTIKTLLGDTNSRDSVIVYVPEESFEGAAKVVTEHFQGNWQYHDRHADAGIFGGVALEAPDGSKFPGIRVAVDPPSLEPLVGDTFNGLQAHILSLSVIEYVKQYYHGDKDKMMSHFMSDYDTAEQLWHAHFGRLYEKNARTVLGPKASMKNIAFFEE